MPKTLLEWVIAFFGAGGMGKFLWDVFNARSLNKKTNSDVTVNLVNSATGYADSLTKRIDSINTRFDDFRRQQEDKDDDRDRRDRLQARLLLEHSRWDHRMATTLREQGFTVEEPPPLFIPEGNEI